VRPLALCLIAAFLSAAQTDPARFGPRGAFRLEPNGMIEQLPGGETKLYPLPQSTQDDYARLRPAALKLNPLSYTQNEYQREETIGPYQVEGDLLWFGKAFYDSEGMRGVGAFGYFDARTRRYTLYSPPEVADCEVSAILIEPDVVWLGLDRSIEDIATAPCSLVRWNRTSHAVRAWPLEFAVNRIAREGASLRLTTNLGLNPNLAPVTKRGYALLEGDVIRRFLVSTGRDGKQSTTPVDRFPPPPTMH
jgi:hypothetical protein